MTWLLALITVSSQMFIGVDLASTSVLYTKAAKQLNGRMTCQIKHARLKQQKLNNKMYLMQKVIGGIEISVDPYYNE